MDPIRFFKSLADETRLRCLLLILHEDELCVCELTDALEEIQPKISRHLAQLRNAGILLDRRQGQWIFYRLHPQLSDWARAVLAQTAAANPSFIQSALEKLQSRGTRPQRTAHCC